MKQILAIVFLFVSLGSLRAQTCDFTFTPNTPVCPGVPIQFTATHTLDSTATVDWDFGDATLGSGLQVSHSYPNNSAPVNYNVTLTVMDSTDTCTVTKTVPVLYQPAMLFQGFTQLCFTNSTCGDSLTLNYSVAPASGPPPLISPYTWNFGDGNGPFVDSTGTVTYTFTTPGTYNVTVQANNSTCASITETIDYFVLPKRPDIDSLANVFCEGDTVNITLGHEVCPDNEEYYIIYWDYPDLQNVDTVSSPGNYSFVYDVDDATVCTFSQSGILSLAPEIRVYAVNDCFDHTSSSYPSWKSTSVNVLFAPHPDFSFCPSPPPFFGCPIPPQPLCWPQDSTVFFDNLSCPDNPFSPLTYVWNFNDPSSGVNNTSTLTDPVHTFSGPGIYNVSLTATNADCGSRTIVIPVELIETPAAAFTAVPDSGCTNLLVNVLNNSTPVGQVQFEWSITRFNGGGGYFYAGGSDSASASPEFVFTQADTFVISLRAFNECGDSIVSDTVRVYEEPTGAIGAIPDTCSFFTWNPTVNLDSGGLPLTNVLWDFGPNSVPPTSTQLDPGPVNFFPQANTSQRVIFTAQNDCGIFIDSVSFILNERIALSGGKDTLLCVGDTSYCLSPSVPGGVWTFNGLPDSAFCFTQIVPDTYYVYYQIDSLGCSFIDTVQIIVSDPPVVDAGMAQSVCPDDTLQLIPSPLGGDWSGSFVSNNGLFVSGTPGSYTLLYCYTDSLSACSNCDSVVITVFPRHSVEAGDSVTFCLGNAIEPLPAATPPGGWWSGPGVVDPQAGTFNPALAGLGQHFLAYTDTNSNGCIAIDTLLVNVIPVSPADAGPDLIFCTNDPIYTLPGSQDWTNIGSVPGFGLPNLFDPGAGSGVFTLVYTVFGGTSCEDTDTLVITVNDTLLVDAGPDLDICEGDSVLTLTGYSPPGGLWIGPGILNGSLGTFDPAQLTPGQTVVLTYEVVDTATACVSRDQRTVTLRPLPPVLISGDSLYCQVPMIQTLPSATPQPGLWSGMPLVDPALGTFDPINTGTGTFTVFFTHTDGFGCVNLDSALITVDIPAVVTIGFGDTALCVNDTPFTLDDALPLGGDWFGNGFVFPDLYDPGQAGVGVDTLIYCYGSNTCRVCDTVLVNVQALPVVNAGIYANVCQNGPAVSLTTGTPAGGVWSGSNVSLNGGVYEFDPLLSGLTTLTYTYTDPLTNCTDVAQTTIFVDTIPVVIIEKDSIYCSTGGLQQLPNVNLTPGVWSVLGQGPTIVSASTGTFDPDTLGSFVFVYTFTAGTNCVGRDSAVITIIEPDSVSAGLSDTVCVNEGTYPLPNFYPLPPNGIWFGGGIVDNVNGIYSPAQAGVGLDTVIYCTGAGSCYICDTITILVEPTPPLAALPDSMCVPDPAISLSDNGFAFGNVAPGVWTGPLVTEPGPGNFVFGPNAPVGTYTVFYTFTDSIFTQGCRDTVSTTVRVDSLPVALIAPLANACVGDSVQFSSLSTDAVSFSWDFGVTPPMGSSQENPKFAYSDTGTYVIQLIARSAVGCADTTTVTILISEPPVPFFTADTDTACAEITAIAGFLGVEVNLTDGSNSANGTYLWDFGGGRDLAGNLSSTNPVPPTLYFEQGTDDTTYTITLTIANYCDTVSFQRTVTVQPLPQVIFGPNFSSGCSPFCINFNNISRGNATIFRWYNELIVPGTEFSTDSIPTQQCYFYNGTGDTTYTIILVAENSCGLDTAYHTITVFPNDIDAFFNTDKTQGCAPLTVRAINLTNAPFSAFGFGDSTTGGGIVQVDTAVHTYFEPGVYWLEHYVNNGCSADTDSVAITVFPGPAVGVVPRDTVVCPGEPIPFVDTTGSMNKAPYVWSMGNGDTLNGISPTYAYSQAGNYTVILRVSSTINGCSSRDTVGVTVNPGPVVNFTASDTVGCEDLTVQFTNTSAGNLVYNWDFGDNNFSNQASPSHTYPQPGTYFVTLTGIDQQGCEGGATVSILVNPQPQSDFSYTLDDSCGVPATATFVNLSGGNPIAYNWDFGNGGSSVQTNPVFIYQTPGIYTVELIAETAFGCQDTAVQTLTVYPQPVAQIGTDTTRGCVPFTVQFTDLSTNNNHRIWYVNGDTITASNFSYTFQQADTNFWVVMVVDTGGVCFDTDSIRIRTASTPSSFWSFLPEHACDAPALIRFTDSAQSTLPVSYQWNFGDGTSGSVLPNPTHIFGQPGFYTVTQVLTNSYGCRDSLSQVVPIYPQTVADFDAVPERGCAPLTVQFTNTSQHYDQVSWNFGDGSPLDFNDNPTHIFNGPNQSYTVRMIVDTAGFCPDTAIFTIEVGEYPVADFSVQPYDSCGPGPVTFVNRSTTTNPPLSYLWDFGNGSFSTQAEPVANYTQAGNYEVTLTVTNAFGCEAREGATVTFYPEVKADFLVEPTELCVGESITITNFTTGADDYHWVIDGQTLTGVNPTYTFDTPGVYEVLLVADTVNKCFDTLTYPEPIIVVANPIARFGWRDSLIFDDKDGTIYFDNQSEFAERYLWDFGDERGRSADENPLYQYRYNGYYDVWLYAYNELGCVDSIRQRVNPKGFGELHLPNAFAPLSGSAGDEFTRFLPKGFGITELDLRVYSIWGDQVWQMTTEDLIDGQPDPDKGWDGTINGRLANGDVFLWKIHTVCFGEVCDAEMEREGSVTLLR